jgi:hypothetical protein
MSELVGFRLGDGTASVIVEVDDDEPGVRLAAGGRDGVPDASATFDAGFVRVREAAARALAQLSTLPKPPSTVELEFGVKLSAQAGAVIAKTGVEGHLKIKMIWERDPDRPTAEDADADEGA